MARPEVHRLRVALGSQGTLEGPWMWGGGGVGAGLSLAVTRPCEGLTGASFASSLHSYCKGQVSQAQFLGDKSQSTSLWWINEMRA